MKEIKNGLIKSVEAFRLPSGEISWKVHCTLMSGEERTYSPFHCVFNSDLNSYKGRYLQVQCFNEEGIEKVMEHISDIPFD